MWLMPSSHPPTRAGVLARTALVPPRSRSGSAWYRQIPRRFHLPVDVQRRRLLLLGITVILALDAFGAGIILGSSA